MASQSNEQLVSIYIPTHNRPDLVVRAIRSVLGQTYRNIELIVCDDGSDWASYAGVRELLENHSAIYLRHPSPMGACAARNRAIVSANGSLITGLDDDDEFTENHVSNLVSSYDSQYSFVSASYLQATKKGVAEKRYHTGEVTLDAQLHYNQIGNQVLTETSRLISVGLFDESMPAMQDYDMWIRLLKAFGSGKKLPDCTYIQHVDHDLDRISNQNDKLSSAYEIFLRKHASLFTELHFATSKIMLSKIHQKQLSIADFLTYTNKHNYLWSVALYWKFTKRKLIDILKRVSMKQS